MAKKIGILRGGMDGNYEKSIEKGGDLILHILENLSEKWRPIDIFIDKEYNWHAYGTPISPYDLIGNIDAIWNTSSLDFRQILTDIQIPVLGALSNFEIHDIDEKYRSIFEKHMRKTNIRIPGHLVLPVYQRDFDGTPEEYTRKKARIVLEKFNPPWIVKSFSVNKAHDMGIHIAKNSKDLMNAILDGIRHGESILIEELILGQKISSHTVKGFRDQEIYDFPITLPVDEKEKLKSAAQKLHNYFDSLKNFRMPYLKADFILNNQGNYRGNISNSKIYLTNIEFTPNLKTGSDFHKACESVGAKMHHVIDCMFRATKNL